ncbi:MAG: hypothetical protein IJI97_00430 [Clostridia bacterium]|nr:hypothetical protein [Clostridia bacterium]
MATMELLGKRFVPEIIGHIENNPGQTYGQIIYAVSDCKGGERTIYLRLEELRREGIIDSGERVLNGIIQRTARLTEYGTDIAGKLHALQEALEDREASE